MDEGGRRWGWFAKQSYLLYHLPYLVAEDPEEAEFRERDYAETEDEQEIRRLPKPSHQRFLAAPRVRLLASVGDVGGGPAARRGPTGAEVPGPGHSAARELFLQSVPLLAES